MLLLLLFPILAHAADPSWRALLHFSGASGGKSSVARESPFFLSKEGYRDPDAELAATRKYFTENPNVAACRYPARALYLGVPSEGQGEFCDRWHKWREAIHAKGAELVFAAAFLSSPSSMYGHTLLKFVRSGQSEGEDLLDYTLNYGANTGSVVGLPYVWMGLTGGFNGNYATAPFYIKVREYNFVENRDFWIYPLKLSEGELQRLVAHSWELRNVDFPYFFLHRNCAFYLLELLEVVRPGSDFTGHFPFWSVPMDTIRLLQKEKLLGTPRLRASRYRRLKAVRNALAPGEAEVAEELAATGAATNALAAGREALLFDAAYELWRYRTEGKKTERPEVENKLLTARSQFNDKLFQADFSDAAPEGGHPSSRVTAAFGENRKNYFAEFAYRGTLHDLLADPQGYEEFSELSMGDLRVRVESESIYLERFDLLRLRSLAPREKWIPRWAWSFRGGFDRAREFPCEAWRCSEGQIEAGIGLSTRLGPLVAFALAGSGVEVGKPFDSGYRIGAGPSGGVFTPLWSGARALVEGDWRWRILGSRVEKREARAGLSQTFSRSWEGRVNLEVARAYREGVLQFMFYF